MTELIQHKNFILKNLKYKTDNKISRKILKLQKKFQQKFNKDDQKKLKNKGYEVLIPHSTYDFAEKSDCMLNEDFDFCERNDIIMDHYKKIEKSDTVLVINNNKNGIKNYIGGSVLGEMAISYYLGKKYIY